MLPSSVTNPWLTGNFWLIQVLVEEFGSDCYEVQEDGRLLLIRNYADMYNLTMWMLTFGDKAEVVEPQEVRDKIKAIAGSMIRKYGGK